MNHRRGSLLIELGTAIAVLAIASTLLVSYLQTVVAQKRQLDQHTVAHQAAANLLERELARSYAEITSRQTIDLWPEAQTFLFDARAESVVTEIAAKEEQLAGKQITVLVSWGKEPNRTVRLVGWRFSPAEETP